MMVASPVNGSLLVAVLMTLLVGLVACTSEDRSEVETLSTVAAQLPKNVAGWTAVEADELYDSESIFAYINGLAEVYLAYGMEACLARRFAGPDGEAEIVLDIFEMGSGDGAFGVWTHDRSGELVDVGQDGVLKHGWLSAWKSRFFISVYAERVTPAAKAAMLEIGRNVAVAIQHSSMRPPMLDVLPAEGLDPESVHYIQDAVILRSHLPLDVDNRLGIDGGTRVVLGDYERALGSARVIVVQYANPALAEGSVASLATALGVPRPEGKALSESLTTGWIVASSSGSHLAAVVEAASEELGSTLLSEIWDLIETGEENEDA